MVLLHDMLKLTYSSRIDIMKNFMGGVIIHFQVVLVVPRSAVVYLVRPTVRLKVVMTPEMAELLDGVAEGGASFLTWMDHNHALQLSLS